MQVQLIKITYDRKTGQRLNQTFEESQETQDNHDDLLINTLIEKITKEGIEK